MKNLYTLLSLCLLLSIFTGNAFGQCIAPGTQVYAFTYNGVYYEIVEDNRTWVSAAACAVARGGYLAEINSQQEQDSIFYWVNQAGIPASNTVAPDGGGASYLWIGGNDIATEGAWIWDGKNTGSGTQFWQGTSSGSPVGGLYNNWGFEPDDFNGQDALGLAITNWPLGSAGQWNDVDHSNSLFFIIENSNPVGIDDAKLPATLSVYPNPGNGRFTVTLPESILLEKAATLEIYNTTGQMVKSLAAAQLEMHITMAEFANGIYFIRLSHADGRVATGKFMLEK